MTDSGNALLSEHDEFLISALAKEGMAYSLIAEKFEVQTSDIVQVVHPSEFYVSARRFNLREKRGLLRLAPDLDGLEKYCKKCEDWIPLDGEFWHRQKSCSDGAYSCCKACECERQAVKRVAVGRKILSGCRMTARRQASLKNQPTVKVAA